MKGFCPDEETMADYTKGRLPEDERTRLEKHLSNCDNCLEELFELHQMASSASRNAIEPVPGHVTSKAIRMLTVQMNSTVVDFKNKLGRSANRIYSKIADLSALLPLGRPSFGSVRSGRPTLLKNTIVVSRQINNIETEIKFIRTIRDMSQIRIRLLSEAPWIGNSRVSLVQKQREIASEVFDPSGVVLFEDIPEGRYCLDFYSDGRKLDSYQFKIRETCHE